MSRELAIVLRGLADYLEGNTAEAETKTPPPAEKPKPPRKPPAGKKAKPPEGEKVKSPTKAEVHKLFQQLSKIEGGRARIDDILEQMIPDGTPALFKNLQIDQMAEAKEQADMQIADLNSNPEPPEETEEW